MSRGAAIRRRLVPSPVLLGPPLVYFTHLQHLPGPLGSQMETLASDVGAGMAFKCLLVCERFARPRIPSPEFTL